MPLTNRLEIIIPGELTDLNTFIGAMNRNRFIGAKLKKDNTEMVAWTSKKFAGHKLKPPFFVEFTWVCKDKRKDKDNIAFAKKFILDGLQIAGVIPQDSWKGIDGFSDKFTIDKLKPRVEIIISSAN